MKPRVLIIGDAHLERLETMFLNWRVWSFAPLRQAEEYAVENGITDIIQVGDVFDSPSPSQQTIAELIDFVKQSKRTWHFLMGNHDKSDVGKNSLTLLKYLSEKSQLKNCRVYIKPTRTKICGIPTVFLPWPYTKSPLLKKRPSLVIAHVEKKGARYDSGKVVSDHDFKLGKHFWVIGHLHEPQEINKNGVFIGAMLQLRHGDGFKKRMLDLTAKVTTTSIECKYTSPRIKLPYRLKTLRINSLDNENWLQEFAQLKPNTFLRLLIHTDVVLPQKYLAHPQVLKHVYFGGKVNREILTEAGLSVVNLADSDVFSRKDALRVYLGKLGLEGDVLEQACMRAAQYEQSLIG
jgi:DNA repair exonuclease SbcCD nuclease subunit